jgi:hypothetical protein
MSLSLENKKNFTESYFDNCSANGMTVVTIGHAKKTIEKAKINSEEITLLESLK